MSVASNILKQMNSKIGGELYTMEFPKEISSKTMLIGIDVCHQGKKSVVGFCASINTQMSKYYSQRIVQKKGQEIVNHELAQVFKSALETYSKNHPKRELPDHFVIYRDGVGDSMRKQVLQLEISQLKKVIGECYNKAAKKPCFTVIIVNKRITQRFFYENEYGQIENPPSGCVIDKGLVENSDSNMQYDFFLIP
jgi:polyribonucleotide nucleotidyltransferase